ncbi:hypothetical protein D915_004498 [Fasciola hepatica]|uniref:Uncharacterized protein n=1 Tax=Fasciola hepatica TaxID=6192 RepID=A0A4E0RE15_FASHE|nr:hypothetical protein D915_004498 [Fasciola hepatica]
MNLFAECEASSSMDNQHLLGPVDESSDGWTQHLVSDTASGLASGPTGVDPWVERLGTITNWRDKVLSFAISRFCLGDVIGENVSTHLALYTDAHGLISLYLETEYLSASVRTCPET